MSTYTKKEIYQIPGKMVGYHLPEINTILDVWSSSLFVSLEDWKSTVFDIGIMDYAPKHRVTSWIIDTSGARSVFPPQIQEFRQNVAKKALQENGVKRLIVVLPETGIGKFSAGKTAELYDSQELHSFDVSNPAGGV
ncbi:MAG: hypothetical protein R8G66_25785 [Cytophagales bacterium]|nr:hypothetical protein [Cytophagales bacterium]